MECSSPCCSFTVAVPPAASDEELPDVAADLCAQCASVDLYALMYGKKPVDWAQGSILKAKASSPCPLCQFLVTAVASKKMLPANPDHELEFELRPEEPRLVYTEYFLYNLKWDDHSLPCRMSDIRVLRLNIDEGDKYLGETQFAKYAVLGNPLDGQQLDFSLHRLEPGKINFALISGWLSYCKAHHETMCGILPGYPRSISRLKVIECETGAIIKLPEGCEFAALSYVWGQPPANEPIKASKTDFLPPHVPKTISDAIQATIGLNLKYLWVDEYCINQRDENELGEQIRIMDMVYHLATITLVATCGEDASFGLPGVSSTLRYKQPAIKINGRTWVSAYVTLKDQIENSRWWSRPWTYQEGLFARRRLYFTETEIFFECNTICIQEGLAYDLHHLEEYGGNPQRFLHRGSFGVFGSITLDDVIEHVGRRQMTYQSDALNVLRGIFRSFSSMPSPIRHFWGIPIDRNTWLTKPSCWASRWGVDELNRLAEANEPGYFDAVFADTLLWRLRDASHRRDGFPSRSWAGWVSPLRGFDAWAIETRGLTMGVKVLLQRKDGTWKRISEEVVSEIDAGNASGTVPYLHILRIETWVVQVTFKYLPDNDFESLQDLLGTTISKAVYFLVLPMTDPDSSSPERQRTGYWPLIPTMAVEGNDEHHRELCEETFDCLLFSPRARYGLVVRKVGNVSERLGYLNIQPFVVRREGPSEFEPIWERYTSTKRFTDYVPMTIKTVMLG
ncbi:hypothetical protein CEP54_010570 [Fusarium duplospermum]|uniref:Heterokaryon incompatibility domain-containing protein n=1 Tax=Fusarium duplospermum TaxID=1325734 RepID=A0A428PJF0_9HYPO|nr:hypothetical protein CEP54_010570 [Fusarium duplospermum]